MCIRLPPPRAASKSCRPKIRWDRRHCSRHCSRQRILAPSPSPRGFPLSITFLAHCPALFARRLGRLSPCIRAITRDFFPSTLGDPRARSSLQLLTAKWESRLAAFSLRDAFVNRTACQFNCSRLTVMTHDTRLFTRIYQPL
jgi:hypothetical protein